jgi:hypothetical protein
MSKLNSEFKRRYKIVRDGRIKLGLWCRSHLEGVVISWEVGEYKQNGIVTEVIGTTMNPGVRVFNTKTKHIVDLDISRITEIFNAEVSL